MLLSQEALHTSKHSLAKDLFSDELIQVFSRKSGQYKGVVRLGEEFNFDADCPIEDLPAEPTEQKVNPNQITLF